MKQIIKNFNNIVKKTIFKVENKTNNNFKIGSFNKHLITLITLLFIYLFYLLLPLLYNKTWVQTNIESKLLNEFNLNLSTSADISYRILPAPHFLIKDSKILVGNSENKKSIAEIKDFKIFLDQRNFLNKEKMNIKRMTISNANFSLLRSDLKLLDNFITKKLSNKKIKVIKSKIFLKNNFEEIISIVKIYKTALFFDNKKLLNFIDLKGEVFNIPFDFNFQYDNELLRYSKIDFNSKLLKLIISNEITVEKELISGKNSISFLNSKINTRYNVDKNLIIFKSKNDKLDKSAAKYAGEVSVNPFDLKLDIYLDNYKISKIYNINPILIEFIKSGILFNKNISLKKSIIINSKKEKELFQKAKINFNVVNGKLNLDDTVFVSDNIGLIELNNSSVFMRNKNLILSTDLFVRIRNQKNLFSFLNTNKKSRKNIKNIFINLEYNYSNNEIKFDKIKIDKKNVSDLFLNVIEGLSDNNKNNIIKSKRIINKLLSIYEG